MSEFLKQERKTIAGREILGEDNVIKLNKDNKQATFAFNPETLKDKAVKVTGKISLAPDMPFIYQPAGLNLIVVDLGHSIDGVLGSRIFKIKEKDNLNVTVDQEAEGSITKIARNLEVATNLTTKGSLLIETDFEVTKNVNGILKDSAGFTYGKFIRGKLKAPVAGYSNVEVIIYPNNDCVITGTMIEPNNSKCSNRGVT